MRVIIAFNPIPRKKYILDDIESFQYFRYSDSNLKTLFDQSNYKKEKIVDILAWREYILNEKNRSE